MLGQCPRHGFYRGEDCPLCHQTGKMLMKDHEIDRVGRIMAGILRHFPERFGLDMDKRGWVSLDDMTEAIRRERHGYDRWFRRSHLIAMAATDEKGRYQVDGGMVRATYGHSLTLELDDLPVATTDTLYYPCAEEELDLILEDGVHPHDRSMVHLSGTPERAYAAGQIHIDAPLLLEINVLKSREAGHQILRAGKEVYVTDAIPKAAVKLFVDDEMMSDLKRMYPTGEEE